MIHFELNQQIHVSLSVEMASGVVSYVGPTRVAYQDEEGGILCELRVMGGMIYIPFDEIDRVVIRCD